MLMSMYSFFLVVLACLPSRRSSPEETHISRHTQTYTHCGWKTFPLMNVKKNSFPYSPHDLCRLMYMMQVSLLLLPPTLSLSQHISFMLSHAASLLFLSEILSPSLLFLCYSIKMKINFLYTHLYIYLKYKWEKRHPRESCIRKSYFFSWVQKIARRWACVGECRSETTITTTIQKVIIVCRRCDAWKGKERGAAAECTFSEKNNFFVNVVAVLQHYEKRHIAHKREKKKSRHSVCKIIFFLSILIAASVL